MNVEDIMVNLLTEFIGIIITVFIIDRILKKREKKAELEIKKPMIDNILHDIRIQVGRVQIFLALLEDLLTKVVELDEDRFSNIESIFNGEIESLRKNIDLGTGVVEWETLAELTTIVRSIESVIGALLLIRTLGTDNAMELASIRLINTNSLIRDFRSKRLQEDDHPIL